MSAMRPTSEAEIATRARLDRERQQRARLQRLMGAVRDRAQRDADEHVDELRRTNVIDEPHVAPAKRITSVYRATTKTDSTLHRIRTVGVVPASAIERGDDVAMSRIEALEAWNAAMRALTGDERKAIESLVKEEPAANVHHLRRALERISGKRRSY